MSIWNGMLYFGWPLPPWCGTVYEVDPKAIGLSSIVVLPDGKELHLYEEGGYLRVDEISSRNRGAAKMFRAKKVFDTNEAAPTFSEEWGSLLWQINAAAAVNALFTVYLTPEEFQRLEKNREKEFEALKQRMSPRAASLVVLLESDFGDDEGGGRPAVCLYRMGMCP